MTTGFRPAGFKYAAAALAVLAGASSAYAAGEMKNMLTDEARQNILVACTAEAGKKTPAREWMKAFMDCAKEKGAVVGISPVREEKKPETKENK